MPDFPNVRVIAGGSLLTDWNIVRGEEAIRFNRDIRPVLSDRCYVCHGPGRQEAAIRLDSFERATEYAVVPGDAAGSEMVARISSSDPDVRMPPADSHQTLSVAEIDTLKRWITEGAEYQPHWAFVPPRQAPLPAVQAGDWPRNAIDHFVLARLEIPEASGEHVEGALDRCVDHDLLADHGACCCLSHGSSSVASPSMAAS